MKIAMHVEGMEEIQKMLSDVMPKESKAILRRTVTKTAADLRKEIKASAPVDKGTLKRAIKSRRNKGSRGSIEASVYITKGSGQKNDAWYWHFVEFGTIKRAARPFIVPAVERLRSSIRKVFGDEFVEQLKRQLTKRGSK